MVMKTSTPHPRRPSPSPRLPFGVLPPGAPARPRSRCSSVQVRVCRFFSRLAVTNSVGRPTSLHPPIHVRARPAKPFRSQAALPGTPFPGGHATGPDSSTARYTVTRPGSAHRPQGLPPVGPCSSLPVRPGRRPAVPPSPARGRGAVGEGRPRAESDFPPPKWLKTLDLCPVFAYASVVGFQRSPPGPGAYPAPAKTNGSG